MTAKTFQHNFQALGAGYVGFANLDRIGDNAGHVQAAVDPVAVAWAQLKNSAA